MLRNARIRVNPRPMMIRVDPRPVMIRVNPRPVMIRVNPRPVMIRVNPRPVKKIRVLEPVPSPFRQARLTIRVADAD